MRVMKQQGANMTTEHIIKSAMRLHDVNMAELADALALTTKTLRIRFSTGNWKFEEILIMIDVLKIEKPQEVFFKTEIV